MWKKKNFSWPVIIKKCSSILKPQRERKRRLNEMLTLKCIFSHRYTLYVYNICIHYTYNCEISFPHFWFVFKILQTYKYNINICKVCFYLFTELFLNSYLYVFSRKVIKINQSIKIMKLYLLLTAAYRLRSDCCNLGPGFFYLTGSEL